MFFFSINGLKMSPPNYELNLVYVYEIMQAVIKLIDLQNVP